MNKTSKRKGLGRGLDALLGTSARTETISSQDSAAGAATMTVTNAGPRDGQLIEVPVEYLQRGRYQPRRDMHEEALQELAESIKAQGVMQPIVIRPLDTNLYEIIAGERRWRACQLAGLEKIPAIV